jgi:hypothetical protein
VKVQTISTASAEQKFIHQQNKRLILEKLQLFTQLNALKPEDFAVGGSACAVYMDYFVIDRFNGIDIFLQRDDINITHPIDEVNVIEFAPIKKWHFDKICRDGFYFQSKEEILMGVSIQALKQAKINDIRYMYVLSQDMNISLPDLATRLAKGISNKTIFVKPEGMGPTRSRLCELSLWLKSNPTPTELDLIRHIGKQHMVRKG